MMKFSTLRTILLLSAALCGGAASAATQGSLGATSSGTVSISLSVAGRVQISGLSDVAFVAVSPDMAATAAQNVCVWSNTATKGYSVTASGNGAGDAFELSGPANPAPYAVAWSDAAGQSAGQASGTPLSAGAALSGLKSSASSPDCSSGGAASSSLIVTVDPATLQAAQPDTTYTGTLNLLVTPQ